MQIKQLMTRDPACCTQEQRLTDVARMMFDEDCGEIPVVDDGKLRHPIGVVTDRDICCRAVAKGKDPNTTKVKECMTAPPVTARPEMEIEECCKLMEDKQIRRVLVVDEKGRCCGIISQADIALQLSNQEIGEVVRQISKHGAGPQSDFNIRSVSPG